MAQENSDLRKIKELIEIMKENELVEVEIKHGEDKIFLKRSQPQQPPIAALPIVAPPVSVPLPGQGTVERSAVQISPPAQQQDNLVDIKSPLVGTFYAAQTPDSEAFVEVGLHIEPQMVICIIEAMKVMNEIKAETAGTVVEVLVKNGQAIEYGQVLFRVKPA